MSKEDKAYIVQLVKLIVHPYFAGEIADILIAHGMTFKTEPQTKGDRIRAMSDEELAKFIGHNSLCDQIQNDERGWCEAQAVCDNCLLEWLKQPAE